MIHTNNSQFAIIDNTIRRYEFSSLSKSQLKAFHNGLLSLAIYENDFIADLLSYRSDFFSNVRKHSIKFYIYCLTECVQPTLSFVHLKSTLILQIVSTVKFQMNNFQAVSVVSIILIDEENIIWSVFIHERNALTFTNDRK